MVYVYLLVVNEVLITLSQILLDFFSHGAFINSTPWVKYRDKTCFYPLKNILIICFYRTLVCLWL